MSEVTAEPSVLDVIRGLSGVTRAMIIRSLSGMATPRAADEIAETLSITKASAQEHIDALVAIGVMTPTPASAATARPQYLIDTATLTTRLEQMRAYLLNEEQAATGPSEAQSTARGALKRRLPLFGKNT